MRGNIKGVAFDLDGTLYPNHRFNLRLIPFVLKELRLLAAFGKTRNIIREEQEKGSPVQGDFYKYQAEITAKLLSADSAQLMEKINSLIYKGWEPLFKKIKLFKYAAETLGALKKAGYRLGMLSDFPPGTKLEYLGLNGFWDAVLSSEECGALKPHPLPFHKLADAMGLLCGEILYVGNSRKYDIAGARRAGMKTAWVKSPFSAGSGGADFSFSNYRKLHDFMLN